MCVGCEVWRTIVGRVLPFHGRMAPLLQESCGGKPLPTLEPRASGRKAIFANTCIRGPYAHASDLQGAWFVALILEICLARDRIFTFLGLEDDSEFH